ncbi:MAG: hypothetical protein ACREV9_12855 [Burkholderiales bacterium]
MSESISLERRPPRAVSASENDLADKLVAWYNDPGALHRIHSIELYHPGLVFVYFHRKGDDLTAVLALDKASYNDLLVTTGPKIITREHVRGAWWERGSPWSKPSEH